MRKRPFSRATVWGRSHALIPAICVGLTTMFVTAIIVGRVISALRDASQNPPTMGTDWLAGVPPLVAALLSGVVAAVLTSFGMLRRAQERRRKDAHALLVLVARLRDGDELSPAERAEAFALMSTWTWLGCEEAWAVAHGTAEDQVVAYLFENLAPQSKVTLWAVGRLLDVSPPPGGQRASESGSRKSRSRTRSTRAITPRRA